MSTLSGRDHVSSSAPCLDGKGGTDSAAKVGKSTKRTGPDYGVPSPSTAASMPNLFVQYTTVYTLNSVHLNQITPSTTTTVSLAAFHGNLLPLLVQ
jgi:hypothetical protein